MIKSNSELRFKSKWLERVVFSLQQKFSSKQTGNATWKFNQICPELLGILNCNLYRMSKPLNVWIFKLSVIDDLIWPSASGKGNGTRQTACVKWSQMSSQKRALQRFFLQRPSEWQAVSILFLLHHSNLTQQIRSGKSPNWYANPAQVVRTWGT